MKRNPVRLLSVVLVIFGTAISPMVHDPAKTATAVCKKWGIKASKDGRTRIDLPMTTGGSGKGRRDPHGSLRLDATTILRLTMKQCGNLDVSTVYGLYGAKTIASMRKLQGEVGVTADGVHGKETHNAMKFMDA